MKVKNQSQGDVWNQAKEATNPDHLMLALGFPKTSNS